MNLTSEQIKAISEIDHNLQIIACAGSGKTEVITRRIANILQTKPDIKPENIVAFTFTNKAADSLKTRLGSILDNQSLANINSMSIGTIHGFCSDLLKKHTDQFNNFKVLDTVKLYLFVQRYVKECDIESLGLGQYYHDIKLYLECIEKMIDDYENKDKWQPIHASVLDAYKKCLYEHNYFDYSLLIHEALEQIDTNQQVQEYLSHIKYLVVDEYQDVNDLQEKLIQKIAEAGANICVVGDDDQTIYQFRGSNANNMITFSERYPDVRQINLKTNFRCAPGIIDVANLVIRNNKQRIAKTMIPGNPELQSAIKAFRYDDQLDEYTSIVEQIKELHAKGIPYREIALLARKGKTIQSLSTQLEQALIPVQSDSAEEFFSGDYYNRFVETLCITTNIDKNKFNACWGGVIDKSLLTNGFKYVRKYSINPKPSLSEFFSGFCDIIGFLACKKHEVQPRKEALNGFMLILKDYEEIYGDWQKSAQIPAILDFLEKHALDEYKYHSFKELLPDEDAVQIMTIHKSKGLEFNTVIIPELMEKEFPASNVGGKKYWHVLQEPFEENKNKYQTDIEDERKLFYVAVTRAKQNLIMTYELSSKAVSCFVKEAAESEFLEIDQDDLTYNSKEEKEKYQRRLNAALSALYNYYGTATQYNKVAYIDLNNIKKMDPDEIIATAIKKGLIPSEY